MNGKIVFSRDRNHKREPNGKSRRGIVKSRWVGSIAEWRVQRKETMNLKINQQKLSKVQNTKGRRLGGKKRSLKGFRNTIKMFRFHVIKVSGREEKATGEKTFV